MIKNFKAVSVELVGSEISNLYATLGVLKEIYHLITENKEYSRLHFSSFRDYDINADLIDTAMIVIESLAENSSFEIS